MHNEPPFFQKLRELEKDKARHDPPAILGAEAPPGFAAADDEADSEQLTSSRKRQKMSAAASLEAMEQKAAGRHEELAGLIKKQNEHLESSNRERSLMREVITRLVEKF